MWFTILSELHCSKTTIKDNFQFIDDTTMNYSAIKWNADFAQYTLCQVIAGMHHELWTMITQLGNNTSYWKASSSVHNSGVFHCRFCVTFLCGRDVSSRWHYNGHKDRLRDTTAQIVVVVVVAVVVDAYVFILHYQDHFTKCCVLTPLKTKRISTIAYFQLGCRKLYWFNGKRQHRL